MRSALLRLLQEGLVDRTDERSPRVAPLTLKDVRDIYGLRKLLEARAPRSSRQSWGSGRRTWSACARSRRAITSCEATPNWFKFLRANREFNMRVVSAAGNARLTEAIAHLQDLTLRILYVGIRSLNVSQWFQATH